jgi:two-component system, cell cycle sensor histidine kinase and response regulator CckA
LTAHGHPATFAPVSASDKKSVSQLALRVVLVYLSFGCFWIFFSDKFVRWITSDPDLALWMSIIKGWGFMLITGLLLYFLIRRNLRRIELQQRDLQEALPAYAQAAQALRESDAQLRAFINANTEPSFLMTATGTILVANPALAKSLGRPMEEIVGANRYEFLPLHLAAEQKTRIDAVIRTNTPAIFEDNQDGRCYLNHIYPVINPAGAVTAVAVFALDMTERIKAESSLRASQERFRALIETTSDWVWEIDSDSRYTYVSPRVRDLLGYEPAEVLGRRPMDFMPPSEAEHAARAFATAVIARAPLIAFINVNLHKDGHKVVLETSAVPITDTTGKLLGYRGIDRDVTERRRVEQQLRLQSSALEAAANAIMISGRDGHIQWVNDAFTKLTGYPAHEVIGQNPNILRSGKHSASHYAALWKTILDGRVWEGELINRRKDGTLYTEKMTVTPVRDIHNQITHFIAIKEDVTQSRALEEQLRHSQKMDAIGRLAGGIAHDFNNILTAIIGYASILQLDRSLTPGAQQHIAGIGQAAERAAALTRQLLAFSRKQALEPKVLDLNTVITDMAKMLRRLIGEHIELALTLSPGLGRIYVDRSQIEQVLLNLAVNARDAMPAGGQLVIQTGNIALSSTDIEKQPGAASGPYILVTIRDNGTGMSEEIRRHLFEPFFTTKEPGKGTGLGLATCHGIITQSGGFIRVESKPGEGSIFKIYLPRTEMRTTGELSNATPVLLPRGTGTILVVEDEQSLRELSSEVLTELGYNVLIAGNGEEAVQLVERLDGRRIDLLFSDVVMPRMGGRKLAEWFRTRHPRTKVLFTSGFTSDPEVWKAIHEGGVEFLEKPFTPVTLATKVQEVLQA